MSRRNGPGMALLADPVRLRIIALLATASRRPSAIARELGLGRPATTRHLKLLRDAGLIVAHRSPIDGRWIVYTISPYRHGAITAWLAGTGIGRPDVMERPD